MAAPNGYSVPDFAFSLFLTFSVNHQDLVVVEKVVARGYTIPLVTINAFYIIRTNIIFKKTYDEIEKRNQF